MIIEYAQKDHEQPRLEIDDRRLPPLESTGTSNQLGDGYVLVLKVVMLAVGTWMIVEAAIGGAS